VRRSVAHSDEPERTLLGAVLVSPGVISTAGDLQPEHFGDVRHATTWAAVQRLAAAGSELDLVTLKAELERGGELAAAGGVLYLAQLLDGVPHFTTLASWADLVRGGGGVPATGHGPVMDLADLGRLAHEAPRDELPRPPRVGPGGPLAGRRL